MCVHARVREGERDGMCVCVCVCVCVLTWDVVILTSGYSLHKYALTSNARLC